MEVLSVVLSIVGGMVAGVATCVAGFYAFGQRWFFAALEHRQAESLAKLNKELERLSALHQARVTEAAYRSRAQFDLEFDVLRKTWERACALREAFVRFGYGGSAFLEDEVKRRIKSDGREPTPEVMDLRRQITFLEIRRELVAQAAAYSDLVHKNEPFVVATVFSACCVVRDLSVEAESSAGQPLPDQNWWQGYDQRTKTLFEAMDQLASAIRGHLARVVIVE
jgi:hypothetical protein